MLFMYSLDRDSIFFFELLLAPSVVDAPITDLPEDRLKAIPLASPSMVCIESVNQTMMVYL